MRPCAYPWRATRFAQSKRLAWCSALWRGARPRQWTKNLLVFVGLVFALELFEPAAVIRGAMAFVGFCLLSSAIYLLNDVLDVASDRQHPVKRYRPVAAGLLSRRVASAAAVVLVAMGLSLAGLLGLPFAAFAVGYLALALTYNAWFKRMVLLDLLALAAGYVVRAVAGAVAVGVPISPWLYLCTTLGALLMAMGKRRHELLALQREAAGHRAVLGDYSTALLDQLMTVAASATVLAYALYTFSAENLPRNGAMMLTIPFVLYGVLRYLYLVHCRGGGGQPEELVLADHPLLLNFVLWSMAAVTILYMVPR